MKLDILTLLLMFTMVSTAARAQRAQREVTKSTTVENDSKPNSDAIPDGVAVSGSVPRTYHGGQSARPWK